MLNIKRKSSILELISTNENIKLKKLVEILNCSEATVRRDLNELESEGLIRRVHGGAVLVNKSEQGVPFKSEINRDAKNKIAKFAAEKIPNGSRVYIDAGSSTAAIIKYLAGKNIVVVTNGTSHLKEYAELGIETYLLGGKLKGTTNCIVGTMAEENLRKYRFDIVFIGTNAINIEGYFTPDMEEASLKSAAIARGKKIYFLCDSSKIGMESFVKFAEISEGTLITEKSIDKNIEEQLKKYKNLKVEVV